MSLVDSARVREWALGTIAEWLPGYTDALEDGHQRKITDVSDDDEQGPLTVSIEKAGFGHGVQTPDVFVVDVTVTRVHAFNAPPRTGLCVFCGQVESARVHR